MGDKTGRDMGDKTGRDMGDKTGRDMGDKTGRDMGDKTGRDMGDKTGRDMGDKTGRDMRTTNRTLNQIAEGDASMNKKALVIGIDNYPSKPLTGCVNDARAVAQLFARHGNGEPNFDVELTTAPQAECRRQHPSAPPIPKRKTSPKGGITG